MSKGKPWKKPESFIDRLRLTEDRIEGMAGALEEIAELPDPVDRWQVLGAALSMDGGDRYSYPVGPPTLADVLPAPAPRRPEA